MKLDWSIAGLILLVAGISALIGGVKEKSGPWQAIGAILLTTWAFLCVLAWFPRIQKRIVKWLEGPELTLPGFALDQPQSIVPQSVQLTVENKLSGSGVPVIQDGISSSPCDPRAAGETQTTSAEVLGSILYHFQHINVPAT